MKCKKSILILVLLMLAVAGTGRICRLTEIAQAKEEEMENVRIENEKLKVEASTDIRDKILAEIRRVFGSKAQQAIKIASCENNPYADNYDPFRVNLNSDSSRDYGIFQVNELWVKVYGSEFKRSWKKNIETAKKIFDRSGNWKMWYSSWNCHRLG